MCLQNSAGNLAEGTFVGTIVGALVGSVGAIVGVAHGRTKADYGYFQFSMTVLYLSITLVFLSLVFFSIYKETVLEALSSLQDLIYTRIQCDCCDIKKIFVFSFKLFMLCFT